MINREREIYKLLFTALTTKFPTLAGSPDKQGRKIPHIVFGPRRAESVVPLIEIQVVNNTTYRTTRTITLEEQHAMHFLQIRVVTGGVQKQKESDGYIDCIAQTLEPFGFLRTGDMVVVQNDPMLYEKVLRYRGIISNWNTVF